MKNEKIADERFLSQSACEAIIARVRGFTRDGGRTMVVVKSWANGELRWARNRVNLASDRRDVSVSVWRGFAGGFGRTGTNQLDDMSLEALVRSAEWKAKNDDPQNGLHDNVLLPAKLPFPETTIWSDATYAVTAETRGALARMLTEDAEAKGMMSAGYVEMRAGSQAIWSDIRQTGWYESHTGDMRYDRLTQAQCSMTVRHPKGRGSGWAGLSSYDWAAVDGAALAKIALEKCLASLDPVRIEPGRYTVILEPQAVYTLVDMLLDRRAYDRNPAEKNPSPRGSFALGYDHALDIARSKLGLQVIDERITISHDPIDPLLGVVPQAGLEPVNWITNGVLTALGEKDHSHARADRRILTGDLFRPSFRMSGGTTSIAEMIKTTQRGLVITRLSNVQMLDGGSILGTGITRDGLWLVENGTVTKAVQNMRFTESPLFVLNQVEQLGVPVPVFSPVSAPTAFSIGSAIVPPIKARDFSFTSTNDAV